MKKKSCVKGLTAFVEDLDSVYQGIWLEGSILKELPLSFFKHLGQGIHLLADHHVSTVEISNINRQQRARHTYVHISSGVFIMYMYIVDHIDMKSCVTNSHSKLSAFGFPFSFDPSAHRATVGSC